MYIWYFLAYIYLATGFIVGIRVGMASDRYVYLIGNIIFSIFVGIFYAFLWVPELLADIAAYITYITKKN